MPMTADIVKYISDNIGTWIDPGDEPVDNGNIFKIFMPSSPDRAVCVKELTGRSPKKTLGNIVAWEEPRLQIVSRVSSDDGFGVAESDAKEIWNLLTDVVNQTINGVWYMSIMPMGNPQPQDLDPNGRPLYVSDFSVMKSSD